MRRLIRLELTEDFYFYCGRIFIKTILRRLCNKEYWAGSGDYVIKSKFFFDYEYFIYNKFGVGPVQPGAAVASSSSVFDE